MDIEALAAIFMFCISTTITPGPNNFIILYSSVNAGFKSALRPYLAVCLGFPLMVASVALLYSYFDISLEEGGEVLKYIGAGYLLYLSYKLASSPVSEGPKSSGHVPGFLSVLLFQWINPKAWAMAVGGVALVGAAQAWIVPIAFLLVIFPAVGVWLLAGRLIREKVIGTSVERYINVAMAGVLALSIVMLF